MRFIFKTSFEDVMRLSSDLLLENEFIDLISPEDIKEHKDVLNALFEFYLDLSYKYQDTFVASDSIKKAALL